MVIATPSKYCGAESGYSAVMLSAPEAFSRGRESVTDARIAACAYLGLVAAALT
jgi:hypothetical protein